jgi:predicted RND superfamily exporter protein
MTPPSSPSLPNQPSRTFARRIDRLIDTVALALVAWRRPIGIVTALITVLLGVSALRTHLDAGFNKLIPLRHPYMQSFLKHSTSFSGANRVLVDVQ